MTVILKSNAGNACWDGVHYGGFHSEQEIHSVRLRTLEPGVSIFQFPIPDLLLFYGHFDSRPVKRRSEHDRHLSSLHKHADDQ